MVKIYATFLAMVLLSGCGAKAIPIRVDAAEPTVIRQPVFVTQRCGSLSHELPARPKVREDMTLSEIMAKIIDYSNLVEYTAQKLKISLEACL